MVTQDIRIQKVPYHISLPYLGDILGDRVALNIVMKSIPVKTYDTQNAFTYVEVVGVWDAFEPAKEAIGQLRRVRNEGEVFFIVPGSMQSRLDFLAAAACIVSCIRLLLCIRFVFVGYQ